MTKMILSPAQAGWQIDLNSRLRNSDQKDSATSVRSARDKKTLLGVVIKSVQYNYSQSLSAPHCGCPMGGEKDKFLKILLP